MLKIYVGRHGQDYDNKEGILNGHRNRPLTHLGRGQSKRLAGEIKKAEIKFDAVYVSPLNRVRRTFFGHNIQKRRLFRVCI